MESPNSSTQTSGSDNSKLYERLGYAAVVIGIILQVVAGVVGSREYAAGHPPSLLSRLNEPGLPLMALGFIYAKWSLISKRNPRLALAMITFLALALVVAIFRLFR